MHFRKVHINVWSLNDFFRNEHTRVTSTQIKAMNSPLRKFPSCLLAVITTPQTLTTILTYNRIVWKNDIK